MAGETGEVTRANGGESGVSIGAKRSAEMAAVFMMSLATIWLRTGLMPRWLTIATYVMALTLILAGETSMWLSLAFPFWVLIVSLLFLVRAGAFESGRRESHRDPDPPQA